MNMALLLMILETIIVQNHMKKQGMNTLKILHIKEVKDTSIKTGMNLQEMLLEQAIIEKLIRRNNSKRRKNKMEIKNMEENRIIKERKKPRIINFINKQTQIIIKLNNKMRADLGFLVFFTTIKLIQSVQ